MPGTFMHQIWPMLLLMRCWAVPGCQVCALQSLLGSLLMRFLWCVQELDHAVTILINDNLELACAVIEKTATDKAIREIDERLLPAYQVRYHCSPGARPDAAASHLHGLLGNQLVVRAGTVLQAHSHAVFQPQIIQECVNG